MTMKMFRRSSVVVIVGCLVAMLASSSVVSAQTAAPAGKAALKNPAALKEQAPAVFKASFDTSAGVFVIEVHRDWAPLGADRFYNLVKSGFFDNVRFFRVIPGFMVQFGMHGDPAVQAAWSNARINDDPVKESNKRGYITYAKPNMPNSRSTQVFINFGDNANLDAQGFAPFGKVITGMNVVDKLNASYGATPGNDQGNIQAGGNAYLEKTYPKLDFIKKAIIEP
jgi:peptidyl-prolyl cis-trans isomerase A (cyclophilin A)